MGANSVSRYGAKGRKDALAFDPESIVIVMDPNHPLYDERVHMPIDAGMVDSIKIKGVIEPVIVRRNGEKVECVVGRQRIKACRQANIELAKEGKPPIDIYALIAQGNDADMFETIIAENEIRNAVNPMTRARNMARLAGLGRDELRIATVFGRTVASVKMTMTLLDLEPRVQQAVADGTIGMAFAVQELAIIPREEQEAKLTELIASGAVRGTEAREAIREIKAGKKPKEKKKGKKRGKTRNRRHLVRLLEALSDAKLRPEHRLLAYVLGNDDILFEHGAKELRTVVEACQ